ncbi:MAG: ABC transporter permease, partial [Actinomycetota bacterium]|nr:ABC transporter permease [Actinomycetota bacterium]
MKRSLARVAQYALVLWAAISCNFLLPHLAPGDPTDYFAGDANALTADQRERIRADYGLDGSLVEQYRRSWIRLARGDLGTSVRYSRPVADVLADRLPWTLTLVGSATVITSAAGVVAGAFAAVRRGRRRDVVMVGGLMVLDSMPGFWIGLVLVAIFAVQLGWLPSFGAVPLDAAGPSFT